MFASSDFSFVNLTDDKKPNRSQCSLAVGRSYRLSVRTNLAYKSCVQSWRPDAAQGCKKVWKSEGARSNVLGIICSPVWYRVNWSAKNFGAHAPLAPLVPAQNGKYRGSISKVDTSVLKYTRAVKFIKLCNINPW